jgi:type I restriction enzyme S subunit
VNKKHISQQKQITPSVDENRRKYNEKLRSDIPSDWKIANIGELCAIKTGKLDVNQADDDGQYPFFTCAEKIYQINTYAFDGEAILVAGNGFFNVKYYTGKFNAYQRTYVLSDINIYGKYLYYYIDYRLSDITGASRGSTIKYIRLGDLRDYPVAVAPRVQQKRIVAEIE